MSKETVEEFLARGGKIQYIPNATSIMDICPDIKPGVRALQKRARDEHREGATVEELAVKYGVKQFTIRHWLGERKNGWSIKPKQS